MKKSLSVFLVTIAFVASLFVVLYCIYPTDLRENTMRGALIGAYFCVAVHYCLVVAFVKSLQIPDNLKKMIVLTAIAVLVVVEACSIGIGWVWCHKFSIGEDPYEKNEVLFLLWNLTGNFSFPIVLARFLWLQRSNKESFIGSYSH